MFTGYSALAIAEALPEDGQLVALRTRSRRRRRSPSAASTRRRRAPGSRSASARRWRRWRGSRPTGGTFDFVFIDADKGGYRDYLDAVLGSGLLAPGGVICVDNT